MESGARSKANNRIRLILGMISAALCLCLGAAVYVGNMWLAGAALDTPHPCVDGGPGEDAVFLNTGALLFRFPGSATNIDSKCYTRQVSEVTVWFDIAPADQDIFTNSLRWKIFSLTPTSMPPDFGPRRQNATYVFGEYYEYPEDASVWIDTSQTPYRVFVNAWLD